MGDFQWCLRLSFTSHCHGSPAVVDDIGTYLLDLQLCLQRQERVGGPSLLSPLPSISPHSITHYTRPHLHVHSTYTGTNCKKVEQWNTYNLMRPFPHGNYMYGTQPNTFRIGSSPEEVGSDHMSRVRTQLLCGGMHCMALACSVYCLVLLSHDLILLLKYNREFKYMSKIPLNQLHINYIILHHTFNLLWFQLEVSKLR